MTFWQSRSQTPRSAYPTEQNADRQLIQLNGGSSAFALTHRLEFGFALIPIMKVYFTWERSCFLSSENKHQL